MTQVIAESPVITLAGIKWFLSLCELWEQANSWLTRWSLPASWRFILYMHVSFFSKDSRVPLYRFGELFSYKASYSQLSPHILWTDISTSSAQLSRSFFDSAWDPTFPFPPPEIFLQAQSQGNLKVCLVYFHSLGNCRSGLFCVQCLKTVASCVVSNFPVTDGRG